METKGIFHPNNIDEGNNSIMAMKEQYDLHGTWLWILSPALFTTLGEGRDISDYPQDVVQVSSL